MTKLKSTFCRGYVDEERWTTDFANALGYIPISKDLIEAAKKIVYEKGMRVKIINPRNKRIRLPEDYLFQENLVRTNPFTIRPVPLRGPDIELHSATEEGLVKLIKNLGFPETKKM